MSERERALEFLALADRSGTRVEPFRYGTAIFNEQLPRRWDSNYLRVDTLPEDVTAEQLVGEADRVQGAAGLLHRKLEVLDDAVGERLAPAFEQLGWRIHRDLLMAHRREPERTADLTLAKQVDEGDLRGVRAELARAWVSDPAVIPELAEAKTMLARVVETRFFAVQEDGLVVSYADLYWRDGTAQIEDVATREAYRGRGYASAVVLRAVEEARRAGCDLVFLVAHADDWPKELYRRLGFDELGAFYEFILPAPPA